MFYFLKDLLIFLFSATEVIEKTADEFKRARKKRYKEFDHKIKEEKKTNEKTNYNDFLYKGREQLVQLSKQIGIATQDEVDEIKYKIDALQKKIDQLLDEKDNN